MIKLSDARMKLPDGSPLELLQLVFGEKNASYNSVGFDNPLETDSYTVYSKYREFVLEFQDNELAPELVMLYETKRYAATLETPEMVDEEEIDSMLFDDAVEYLRNICAGEQVYDQENGEE